MASQALLTFRQLMLSLQRLCKERRSGVMSIIDEQEAVARFELNNGLIFNVTYQSHQGREAISLIRQLKQAKGSFSRSPAQESVLSQMGLSTLNVFRLLSGLEEQSKPERKPAPQQKNQATPEPSASPNSSFTDIVSPLAARGAESMLEIEAQIAILVGPVAQIIYQDYAQTIQHISDFKKLNHILETLAKKSLNPSQQKLFQQGIITSIAQQKLKDHDDILALLKTPHTKSKISVDAMRLCLMNYSLQGGVKFSSLKNLMMQVIDIGSIKISGLLHKLLRLIEQTQQTGLLEMKAGEKSGSFYFEKGQMVNAFEFGMTGKLIALDILQWDNIEIQFTTNHTQTVPHNINAALSDLIADSKKFHADPATESGDHHYNEVEEEQLTNKAIFLAEANDVGMAEKLLIDILTSNNTNAKAWIWLARISSNLNVIDVALTKASQLQNKSAALSDEIKKFTAIKKSSTETAFVLHCPFCWGIVPEKTVDCPHCKSHFYVSNVFFKTEIKVKTEVLDKAIQRFSLVIQQWPKAEGIYSRFYLAMAYLNQKYYQEALDQLNEIVALVPDNRAFYVQAQILLQYLNVMGIATTGQSTTTTNVVTERIQYKILVVEDSMVTRKVIVRTLTGSGYIVFEAKDSIEALDGLVEKAPDLILLDIILPGKSGYEILSEIKDMPSLRGVPVVMLTSRDSLFDKLKGKVSEANEYLTKPFKPDELLAIVTKYLK
ncbi:MAG: response regulator [Methyloprofundus sp.]|nr:response regulator [Methyloprofundus sp.]